MSIGVRRGVLLFAVVGLMFFPGTAVAEHAEVPDDAEDQCPERLVISNSSHYTECVKDGFTEWKTEYKRDTVQDMLQPQKDRAEWIRNKSEEYRSLPLPTVEFEVPDVDAKAEEHNVTLE